jgi:hypothetical protein
VATPELLVEVGLDISSVGGPFFTFGSSSDPKDNPQSQFAPNGEGDLYRFGGTLFYDVTERVKSVTINRGKSRELDKFTTGSANITFTNQDRAFDPFYTSSPYYPDIRPRRNIRISTIVNGSTAVQFTGLVEDWNIDYNISGQSDAFAACVDGFILFGGQQLAFATATSQKTGARIGAILDRAEVDWPADLRDIDTGVQTLQGDVIEQGRETLDYLQLVEASEPGLLFMSKDNKVTFRDRSTAAYPGTVVFSDAGTAIPYNGITVNYGTELLFNRAVVSRLGAGPQTSENAASIAEYGVVSLELNGLLMSSTSDALALSQFIVNKYSDPELRIDSLDVQLAGLGTAAQTQVLGLELADIIRVEFQPNDIGDAIVKDVQIIGIRHDARPASHVVSFALQSTDTAAFVFAGGTVTSGTAVAAEYPFSVFDSSPFGL